MKECGCGRVFAGFGKRCGPCRYKAAGPEGPARARKRLHARLDQKAGRPCPDKCEVCGSKATGKGRSDRRLNFEHNHDTGQFRGWLCNLCNVSIGAAGDNPRILAALAVYLQAAGCAPARPVIR